MSRRHERIEQLRQRYWQRASSAEGHSARIAVAADHLRAALKYSSAQQQRATTDAVVAELARQAEHILTRGEKGTAR